MTLKIPEALDHLGARVLAPQSWRVCPCIGSRGTRSSGRLRSMAEFREDMALNSRSRGFPDVQGGSVSAKSWLPKRMSGANSEQEYA